MKFTLHLALVASLVTCAQLQPAHAQYAANSGGSIKIKKDALEQVTWFKGRRQIRIVDESADVRDLRQPKDDGVIEIAIPPAPRGSSAAGTIPAGGIKLPGAGNVIVASPTLPSAGFGSNIPAHRAVPVSGLPKGLPNGSTTNMLAGRMADRAALKPSAGAVPLTVAHHAQPTAVNSYGSYAPSAVGTSAQSGSTASVTGQLLPRRSLLGR